MKKHLIAFALLASSALSALAANPLVELKTNQGDIVVEVFADKAPKSADNFIQYVKDGFYNRTVFHRVIDGFMIQGGGFDADMKQKSTRAPIENEARNGLRNEVGTLAMARTADPHSASSQFFINLVANTALDYFTRTCRSRPSSSTAHAYLKPAQKNAAQSKPPQPPFNFPQEKHTWQSNCTPTTA